MCFDYRDQHVGVLVLDSHSVSNEHTVLAAIVNCKLSLRILQLC